MTTDFSSYSRIPSLPTIAVEALKLFSDPDSSNEQLVGIIRKDPAIVSKLLKAANSAKYGVRGEVTDMSRAVMLMGRATVAPLVLSFSLARQSMESSEHLEHYQAFWWRSFVQATAAEALACQYSSPAFRSECYTTSILSGLGKLALLKAEPVKYLECLTRSRSMGVPLSRAEQDVFGFTHAKLSSILLQQMGLPERCHQAIRALTDAGAAQARSSSIQHPLIEVTRLADAVATLICDDTPAIVVVHLEEALAGIQLPQPLSAEAVISQVQDQLEIAAPLFDIDPPNLPSASDLLQDALDQLARLAEMADDPDRAQAIPVELMEENGRLKRRVADLLHVSRVDSLTGLCNRGYLLQELSERAALHRVRGLSLGLAVVDIDHFKKINDSYGHQAGDEALKAVATTLQETIRDTDLVGRYGGEEFVVILEDANAAGLAVVGERLRKKIENTVFEFEGKRISITGSIGLAEGQVVGSEQEFGAELFACADAAMYRAKNAGRNCFVVETLLMNPGASICIERSRSKPVPAMV